MVIALTLVLAPPFAGNIQGFLETDLDSWPF